MRSCGHSARLACGSARNCASGQVAIICCICGSEGPAAQARRSAIWSLSGILICPHRWGTGVVLVLLCAMVNISSPCVLSCISGIAPFSGMVDGVLFVLAGSGNVLRSR